MKKVVVTLLIAALGASAFAANGEPENAKALNTFNQLFGTATQVQWNPIESVDLMKASFIYKGESMEAYFDNDGDMLVSGRYISQKQLPVAVTRQISEKFAGYAINPRVIESETDGASNYYITLASAKHDLMVKAAADGSITVYKKLKK